MGSNAAYFKVELAKEARKHTAVAYRNFRDKLLLDALAAIDAEWRVDTGFSRASNLPFIDSPLGGISLPQPDKKDYPRGSKPAVPAGQSDLEKLDQTQLVLHTSEAFATVGIASNVIYAPVLEAKDHVYKKTAEAIKDVVASAEDFTDLPK